MHAHPASGFGLVNPMKMSDGFIAVSLLVVGGLWNFFVHSNVRWRLGPVEWLISTPGFHHWHHTGGSRRDRNYASMLPWLDRIFGTHYLPKEWPESYGIDEPMPASLAGQLIQPLQPQRSQRPPARRRPPLLVPAPDGGPSTLRRSELAALGAIARARLFPRGRPSIAEPRRLHANRFAAIARLGRMIFPPSLLRAHSARVVGL